MKSLSTPPFNEEAEKIVLGSIITTGNMVDLATDDFYTEKHKVIFEALKKLKTIDIITLSEALKNKIKTIGGRAYLANLITSNIGFKLKPAIEVLKETSHKRKIRNKILTVGDKIDKDDYDINSLVEEVYSEIKGNNIEEAKDDVVPFSQLAELQKETFSERYNTQFGLFDTALDGGFKTGDLVIVSAPTGFGKCLGKDTPVIMHNGDIKKVQNIKVGDMIMGDDSTSRKILSTVVGEEELFEIIPIKGDSYIVNKSHILSLKKTREKKGDNRPIVNISVADYIKKSKWFKHIHKGYRKGISFKEKNVPIDPYFIGLWLADGTTSNVGITTPDKEIIEYLYKIAKELNLKITKQEQKNNKSDVYSMVREKKYKPVDKRATIGGYGDVKSLKSYLQDLNLINNKHIPKKYKCNSRNNRLKLLAGLLDGDGWLRANCLNICQKNERLMDDIIYLCRSLGYACYKQKKYVKKFNKTYFIINISGDLTEVPLLLKRKRCKKRLQKKDPLVYGFKVKSLGIGKYYGFEIDKNKLFMLGDFTVTHNTSFTQNLTFNFANQGLPCLWFSYEVLGLYLQKKFVDMGAKENHLSFIPLKHTSGSLDWIEQKIIESKKKFYTKFVAIDHLGFLLPRREQKNQNYSAYLGQICRDLKMMAMEHEIIILLPVHMRKTDNPKINDIRDSSGIAQEADAVFTISREENQDKMAQSEYTNHSLITLAKNRATGQTVKGWFEMINNLFEYDYHYSPQEKLITKRF